MTFFVDRNLEAKAFILTLQAAGIVCEPHSAHFRHDTKDRIWIPEVSALGWIIVTGDRRIASNPDERQAVIDSGGRSIHLVMGRNGTHKTVAVNFVNSFTKIDEFVKQHQAPFLAVLTRPNEQDFLMNKPGKLKLDNRPI